MESTLLIAAGSLVTVIGGVFVTIRKSNSDSNASTITGGIGLADYWEKRAGRIEVACTNLEEEVRKLKIIFEKLREDNILLKDEMASIKKENIKLSLDNEAKSVRITVLEKQIIDLQGQLDAYNHIDVAQVDEAKASLHKDVEQNLENLKPHF